jgi:hypothetical protein
MRVKEELNAKIVAKILADEVRLRNYRHTYHSRFILEGVAEVSQIFLRDAYVLPVSKYYRRDRW